MARTPLGGRRQPLSLQDAVVDGLQHTRWHGLRDDGPRKTPMSPKQARDAFLLIVAGRDVLLGHRGSHPDHSSNSIRGVVLNAPPDPIADPFPDSRAVIRFMSEELVQIEDVNARWRYLSGLAVDATTRAGKHLDIWRNKEDYLADLVAVCMGATGIPDSRTDALEANNDLLDKPPSAIATDVLARQGALGALDEWYAVGLLFAIFAYSSDWVGSQTAQIYVPTHQWERIYEIGLQRCNRTLRPGLSYRGLAMAITSAVDGASLRWYFDRSAYKGADEQSRLDSYLQQLTDTVLAILVGYTSREEGARSLADELDGPTR